MQNRFYRGGKSARDSRGGFRRESFEKKKKKTKETELKRPFDYAREIEFPEFTLTEKPSNNLVISK